MRYKLALGPKDEPVGPTYRAAQNRFEQILEGVRLEEKRREKEKSEPRPVTVREILETYLKHISNKRKAGTIDIRVRSWSINFARPSARSSSVRRSA